MITDSKILNPNNINQILGLISNQEVKFNHFVIDDKFKDTLNLLSIQSDDQNQFIKNDKSKIQNKRSEINNSTELSIDIKDIIIDNIHIGLSKHSEINSTINTIKLNNQDKIDKSNEIISIIDLNKFSDDIQLGLSDNSDKQTSKIPIKLNDQIRFVDSQEFLTTIDFKKIFKFDLQNNDSDFNYTQKSSQKQESEIKNNINLQPKFSNSNLNFLQIIDKNQFKNIDVSVKTIESIPYNIKNETKYHTSLNNNYKITQSILQNGSQISNLNFNEYNPRIINSIKIKNLKITESNGNQFEVDKNMLISYFTKNLTKPDTKPLPELKEFKNELKLENTNQNYNNNALIKSDSKEIINEPKKIMSETDNKLKLKEEFQNLINSSFFKYPTQKEIKLGIKADKLLMNKINLSELPKQINQIVNIAMKTGFSSAKLILTPETLGTIKIEISIVNNVVSISMKTDNPESLKLVEMQIPMLKDKLASVGIETSKIETKFENYGDTDNNSKWTSNNNNTNDKQKERDDLLRSLRILRELNQTELNEKMNYNQFYLNNFINTYNKG